MPGVSQSPEDSWGLAALEDRGWGAVEPPELEAVGLTRTSRTSSTLSEPDIEVTGGAVARVASARGTKVCYLHSVG